VNLRRKMGCYRQKGSSPKKEGFLTSHLDQLWGASQTILSWVGEATPVQLFDHSARWCQSDSVRGPSCHVIVVEFFQGESVSVPVVAPASRSTPFRYSSIPGSLDPTSETAKTAKTIASSFLPAIETR